MCETDRRAIQAMGEALRGTDKPFVITSGVALVTASQLALETDPVPAGATNPRTATEQAADALAAQGTRVSVVRLAPSVHGLGDVAGFVPILINMARQKGVSA